MGITLNEYMKKAMNNVKINEQAPIDYKVGDKIIDMAEKSLNDWYKKSDKMLRGVKDRESQRKTWNYVIQRLAEDDKLRSFADTLGG